MHINSNYCPIRPIRCISPIRLVRRIRPIEGLFLTIRCLCTKLYQYPCLIRLSPVRLSPVWSGFPRARGWCFAQERGDGHRRQGAASLARVGGLFRI